MPVFPRTPRLVCARTLLAVLLLWLSPLALADAEAEADFMRLRQASTEATLRLDFAAAEALHRRMRALAESAARPGWLGWTLHSEATAARRQGRSDEALRLFSAALEQFRLQGDRLGEIEALNDRATLLRRGGSLYQALDGHTRALQLARELGLPGPIAESLAKIARIYAELDDLEPAADFYRQAIAAADPAAPGELAELESDLAGILLRQGQLEAAVSASDSAIALAERSGNPAVLGTAYGRRARVLLQQGRAAEALDWIDRAIAISAPFDGARSVLVRRATRLEVLVALERWDEAASLVEPLLAESRRTGDVLIERSLMDHHAEILMALGDAAGAYAAARRYHSIQQGMATTMTSRRIADLEASMQRRQMEADVQLLQRQGELQALTVERQRLIGLVMASALVCVLLAVVALVWRYRAVQRLHRALQQSAQALQQAARTDPLTGLGNRQAIPDARALAAVAAQRGERLGVILIDLDHFKRINDEHGHLMGDQVLQAVASALRLALPAELQLVRWGGEEFLACGSFRDREHALAVAESLRRAVRAHPPRDSVHAPSISLGVSLAEPPVEAWDGLIREADRALYAAKESGRNRVCMAAAA